MLFGTAKRISSILVEFRKLKVFCNGVLINNINSYTYLGTILDQSLTLRSDFGNKYRKASKRLGLLRMLASFLKLDAAWVLYSSIIVSALKHNCIVHLKLNQEMKLRSLKRRADKILKTKTTPIMNTFIKHAVLTIHKCLHKAITPSF